METRAPFMIVGAFVLAAIVAVFGFIYWLNNAGGIGKRETYHIVFNGPVPGLLVGAAVLFNGIRVGEVTSLDLVADRPHDVHATIAVAEHTPVRANTKVSLDFQGLTGVPVVALEGGEDANAPRVEKALIAEKGAGESMTQAARNALRKVDNVLSENATPLHQAITNLNTFTDGLARNTPKLDGIVAGLERMTGSVTPPRTVVYDLKAADKFQTPHRALKPGLFIAEPTATTRLQTQRFLFSSDEERHDDFANAQWSDALPQLVQAKLLQSFENYDVAHAPLRGDGMGEGGVRLLIDLRRFDIATAPELKATIAFSAKLVDGSGHLKAARIFEQSAPITGLAAAQAATAFDQVFTALAHDVVTWTASVQ
ncbi:MAG: membrane integrity-associated transporter subunit PqiC [Proteobacteria bacterium]|nr:membrane integrity-associated transporter subunit PqiC [Pseudomonadota bacterium]